MKDIVELLLKYGADYNSWDEEGLSAFHLGKNRNQIHETILIIFNLAAKWGKIEIIKVFLDYGADINSKTRDGKTVIDLGE